jgi:type IV pilus assembly protein PilY1
MRRVRKVLAIGLILQLLSLSLPSLPARADDTQLFSTNVQPIVMILLDSSNSMLESGPIGSAIPYSAATTYTVPRNGTSYTRDTLYYWRQSTGTYRVSAYSTVAGIPSSEPNKVAATTALNSLGVWTGLLNGMTTTFAVGNYLNYQQTSSASTTAVKWDVAKKVITDLLNSTTGVQFGLATFSTTTANYQMYGGGYIWAGIGTDPASIILTLNGLGTNGGTPLGGALYDMGKYFTGNPAKYNTSPPGPSGYQPGQHPFSTTFPAPTLAACAPIYVIVVSDGQPNDYTNNDNTATANLLSVKAAAALKANTTASGTPQPILVDTIGFSITGTTTTVTNSTLQAIANAGGGQFYSAANETDLVTALRQATGRILSATFSFASPVIPTTSATGTNRAYLASFQSNPSLPFWQGNLKAYTLTSTGQIPTDANNKPDPAAIAWDAGSKLNALAPSDRTIYTLVNGALTSFTTGTITPDLLGLAATATTDRDNVVNFIRGTDSYNLYGNGTGAQVPWKLGDIFHSTPVLIRPPFAPSTDLTYSAFVTANAARPTILLAGANDGMVHAFRESDGVELWAFIPDNILPDLRTLTDGNSVHPFLVDASPIAADIKIGATWKTIVIIGERAGGNSYTALDITDTAHPRFLWKFTDSKIAETWSEPIIGKVRMDPSSTGTTERYVAFFGGGFDTDSNNAHGAAVFALDAGTGALLWQYYNNSTTDDRKYMNYSIPSNPLALDLDSDGYLDHLYIPDAAGQIWKFVLPPATLSSGTSGTVSNWNGKRFFAAPNSQANPPAAGAFNPDQGMYYPPTAALDSAGALWLYVGTGDRNFPIATTTGALDNRLYGLKDTAPSDTTNGSTLTESVLANVSTTNGTRTSGWYVILGDSEKVLAAPTVLNNTTYFTSFVPTNDISCTSGGGSAYLYAVQMSTGYAALSFAPGAAGARGGTGSTLTNTGATTTRRTGIGTGIPSKPIILINDTGGGYAATVMASTTNQELSKNTVPAVKTLRILYWTER